MADHREIGAFQVNGQWATQIAYEASVREGRVSEAALTFVNRRSQVAAFQGDREQVLSILGERNLAVIESGAGVHDDKVKGRLGGATLHYRAVVLPHAASAKTPEPQPRDAENAIERDSLPRQSERGELPEVAVGAAAPAPAAPAQPTALTNLPVCSGKLAFERLPCDRVQGNRAPLSRLRVLCANVKQTVIEIDVRPIEQQRFAAPESREEAEQGETSDCGQKE